MNRPRGLTLAEALVAVTLLGAMVLSVMTLFAMAARDRLHADHRARGALVVGHELSRAAVSPARFLHPSARGAWVREDSKPPEFSDVEVLWQWEDDPSGSPGLALVRVRATWEERPSGLSRSVEAATLVQRP